MFCQNCGYKTDAKYCPKCGTEIRATTTESNEYVYQAERTSTTSTSGNKGLAIAAFICGIVGIASLNLPAAIFAFIAGGKCSGFEKGQRGRKLGKIGIIVCSIVYFLYMFAMIIQIAIHGTLFLFL